MKFLTCALVFLFSFNSLAAIQINFEEVSEEDIIKLENHIVSFYSEELIKAGLFRDTESAIEAAKEEFSQEAVDNPDMKVYYFYLTSDEMEDKYCGYMSYSIKKDAAYLEAICVDQKYRGLGIGKSTLEILESELREIEIQVIKLYVFAHNQVALNLYKKMGYVIETTYFNNALPVGHHMQKKLVMVEPFD